MERVGYHINCGGEVYQRRVRGIAPSLQDPGEPDAVEMWCRRCRADVYEGECVSVDDLCYRCSSQLVDGRCHKCEP